MLCTTARQTSFRHTPNPLYLHLPYTFHTPSSNFPPPSSDILALRSPTQDLPGAQSDAQIAEGLGLHDIKNRPWAIFKTSAVKGEGLFEVRKHACLARLPFILHACLATSLVKG